MRQQPVLDNLELMRHSAIFRTSDKLAFRIPATTHEFKSCLSKGLKAGLGNISCTSAMRTWRQADLSGKIKGLGGSVPRNKLSVQRVASIEQDCSSKRALCMGSVGKLTFQRDFLQV